MQFLTVICSWVSFAREKAATVPFFVDLKGFFAVASEKEAEFQWVESGAKNYAFHVSDQKRIAIVWLAAASTLKKQMNE